MHRPLAEVMVDAKDRRHVEGTEQHPVEFLCGGAVVTEGFFNDDASAFGAVRLRQLFYDQPEQRRWDGEVVRRLLRGAQLLADGLKGRRVLVVAVHIVEMVRFSFWFVLVLLAIRSYWLRCCRAFRKGALEILTKPSRGRFSSMTRKIATETAQAPTGYPLKAGHLYTTTVSGF